MLITVKKGKVLRMVQGIPACNRTRRVNGTVGFNAWLSIAKGKKYQDTEPCQHHDFSGKKN